MVLYPFAKIFEVMKPNTIAEGNKTDEAKLQQLLRSPQYAAEPKIDGCHYTCINGRFFSTHISTVTGVPVEKTENYPHLAEVFGFLGWNKILLDGEINYPGMTSQDVTHVTGTPYAKTAIEWQEKHGWVEYRLFDILRAPDGQWLLDCTWQQRRCILEQVAQQLHEICPQFVLNPYVVDDKAKFVQSILDDGGEGAVLKKRNGLYVPGTKTKWEWMKIKQHDTEDVVITGFSPATKKYTGSDYDHWPYWENGEPVSKYYALHWIGSINYGKYKDGELVETGSCSGIKEVERQAFSDHPEQYVGRVMQIKFMEKTNDGNNRHANFVQLHPDKNPLECKM